MLDQLFQHFNPLLKLLSILLFVVTTVLLIPDAHSDHRLSGEGRTVTTVLTKSFFNVLHRGIRPRFESALG